MQRQKYGIGSIGSSWTKASKRRKEYGTDSTKIWWHIGR